MSKKVVLIDADSIIFILAWHARDHRDVRDMELQVDQFMVELIQKTGATHYLGVFTPPKTFRNDLYSEYKANRRGKAGEWVLFWKPIIIKLCTEKYGFFMANNIEADDVLSIMRDFEKEQGTEVIFCSPDKDLKQIPGKHYDYSKQVWLNVSTEEACRRFWTQMLVGDSSDNIPGCRGIGEKKAPLILEGAKTRHEMELRVKEAYRTNKKYESEDEASVWYSLNHQLLDLRTGGGDPKVAQNLARFVQEVQYSDSVLDDLEQLNSENHGQDREVLQGDQRPLEGDILCPPPGLSEQV